MPGSDDPLFSVAPGQMDFGLGIHGEPGINSAGWMPAAELAKSLVDTVLAEGPRTADLGGKATTGEFTDAVIEAFG